MLKESLKLCQVGPSHRDSRASHPRYDFESLPELGEGAEGVDGVEGLSPDPLVELAVESPETFRL